MPIACGSGRHPDALHDNLYSYGPLSRKVYELSAMAGLIVVLGSKATRPLLTSLPPGFNRIHGGDEVRATQIENTMVFVKTAA
jgi:hypothetical protein